MTQALRILVTRHALDRARQRVGLGERQIILHVTGAIEHGRKAVREPAWAKDPAYGRRNRADRTKGGGAKRGELRWVWDDAESVAYLVRFYRDHVTVITAVPRHAVEAA